MEELFFRHYQAIKARGLINDETTLDDFLIKLDEEVNELYDAKTDDELCQEAIDVICVLANMLKDMDVDLKTELEKNVITQEKRAGIKSKVTPKSLKRLICELTDVKEDSIFMRTRKREIIEARHLYAYYAKKLEYGTLSQIGSMIGDFDHSTVLFACNNIDNLRTNDKRIIMLCKEIESKIELL